MNFRRLTLSALSVLAVATAVGCGQTGTLAPVANTVSDVPVAAQAKTKDGLQFRLDFDMKRYKTVFAPKAHPHHLNRQGMLPSKVDNRGNCPPVYNQGQLGSCTAFAMGKGLREYMQRTNHEQAVPLSALFLYYEERVKENKVSEDSGATITEGMEVLRDTGIAPDDDWSYGWLPMFKFKKKPPQKAYDDAGQYKVHEIDQLATLDDVKTALAAGQAVSFGFEVFQDFQGIGHDGVMVMPHPEQGEQVLGGHAVLAVGYNDATKMLIVRNSWGDGWGDRGYFYMPYDFFSNKDWADDVWTAK